MTIKTNIVEIYVDLKKMRLEAINESDIITYLRIPQDKWETLKEILEAHSIDSNEIAGEPMILYYFKHMSVIALASILSDTRVK